MFNHINFKTRNIGLILAMAIALIFNPVAQLHAQQDVGIVGFERTWEKNFKWMRKNLDLSADQHKKLDEIKEDTEGKFNALQAYKTKDEATKKTELDQIRMEANEKIREVLTPAQWEKYQNYLLGTKGKGMQKVKTY